MDKQARTLAERAVLATTLDPREMGSLLTAVEKAGTTDQVRQTLIGRLPAAGLFRFFLGSNRQRRSLPVGCEPDGTAAAEWT